MNGRHSSLSLLLASLLAACGAEEQPASRVVVTEPLPMPGLDRERRLRIYLPPGYAQSGKRYPVLYLHDGQNLFDEETAYAGEWQVDETLDEMAASGGAEIIAVGIDNGGEKRLDEMAPWPHGDFGEAEADAYIGFIVGTAKPWVDARYRTLPGREHTGILGSSMGGLVSHYAAWRHAEIFSKAGLFSPSYWWSRNIFSMTESAGGCPDSDFYLVVGGDERDVMIDAATRMHGLLEDSGCERVVLDIVAGGEHNEALWRSRFGRAVRWLYGDGTSP